MPEKGRDYTQEEAVGAKGSYGPRSVPTPQARQAAP